LGSVRQLVDANGEVLLAQSCEPYGAMLESVGEEESSYGFTGDQKLIALMTGIEPHVVAQYYDLVEKYQPEKLLKN
jgi:hypothetical protein